MLISLYFDQLCIILTVSNSLRPYEKQNSKFKVCVYVYLLQSYNHNIHRKIFRIKFCRGSNYELNDKTKQYKISDS